MTLNHISEKALIPTAEKRMNGIDALGVMKADVDNLGLIIACGMSDSYYSVSRAATLSRQMNNFFAVYLPWFLEQSDLYMDIYTVFAGGDDLFLIGPWNKMADLASELNEAFRDYTGRNPLIHFSAGISIHKSHTPVDKMADAAQNALAASKKHTEKQRLTLFDETVTWDELKALDYTAEKVRKWLEENALSRVMLYSLNTFIAMAAQEKKLTESGVFHISSMQCTKWRSYLAYTTERNIGKHLKEGKAALVKEVHASLADWLNTYGGKLRIPLWTLQYNSRSRKQ
jgi:CRISPR-associated protein Csm1